jgi:hypothetical protein
MKILQSLASILGLSNLLKREARKIETKPGNLKQSRYRGGLQTRGAFGKFLTTKKRNQSMWQRSCKQANEIAARRRAAHQARLGAA